MELTHTFTIPAAPDAAWELLTDLHRVGSCFPGATVTEADAEEFSGTVKVKLGPIALTYAGTGKFVERDDAAHRAVIEARGKDRRGNGTASATVTMSLTGDGDGSRAEVLTDLSVTGKPAQFGRGVMQDVSDKLLGQFVACIEGQFSAEGDGASGRSGAAAGASARPPSEQLPEPPEVPEPPELSEPAPPQSPPMPPKGPEPTPTPTPTPSPSPQAPPTERAQPAPGPVPAPEPAPASAPRSGPAAAAAVPADDAIDLGSAVLPVLLQRYAGALAVGAAGFVAGVLVGRTGRR